jgi:hypothetical protein
MCTEWVTDDVLGFDPPKAPAPVPTVAIGPPPAAAPTKSSDEIQAETEEERRRRAASTQSISASKLTGGLGDADFSSVSRVTLG